MIPPKYRFYVGKSLLFNLHLSDTTSAVTSYLASLDSESRLIYVNYTPSSDVSGNAKIESLVISMYDSANEYLGQFSVYKAGLFTLKEGTAQLAIEFIGLSENIQDIHKEFIKTGFSEIYTVKSARPYYKELAKKYAKENNQIFFRQTLEGKINLLWEDYRFVNEASINDTLLFIIEKRKAATDEWYEYYKGQFNKTDCKLDYDLQKCELKLTALDQYNAVLDGYENTYDLIKLAPAISKIEMYKRPVIQLYILGGNTISNYFGGTYWEDDVNEAVDSADDLVNKYHFSYLQSANEFTVQGLGISEVNGVYAGSNGVWKNQNGYTCSIEAAVPPYKFSNIFLTRDSDGAVLYMSQLAYEAVDINDFYLGPTTSFVLINMEDKSDRCNVETALYQIYERLLIGSDDVGFDLPTDNFVSDNRNYKKCIGYSLGSAYCSSEFSSAPTKYGVNDFNQYFTNNEIYNTEGLRPLPLCRSSWVNTSLWYTYSINNYAPVDFRYRKTYTLNDSYSIGAVIKALLAKISPSITHEETAEYSQFLYGDSLIPSLKQDLFYVYITQKTNILKGQYDQAAQKAETTLKDIMDMLRTCFKCYWYIEDNKFKIEHSLYFRNGRSYDINLTKSQLNLTRLKDQFNKKAALYFQSQIEFDKSELNSRYEFNWMDDTAELFSPVNVDVKAKYVQSGKTEEVSVNNFSSDVDFMLLSPSNFSEDGFALLCPVKDDAKLKLPVVLSRLINENGWAYDIMSQNWLASWPYLVDFYKYDMPAYNIDVDVLATPMSVLGIKKSMTHTVSIHTEEDFDELKSITTSLGKGIIEEMSINIDTRLAEVKLSYEPK